MATQRVAAPQMAKKITARQLRAASGGAASQPIGKTAKSPRRKAKKAEKPAPAPWLHENQFRALMDASPSIIHFKDRDGRYVAVNAAFEAQLKLPREEILGKTVLELTQIDEGFVDNILALDREVLRTGKAVQVKSRPPLPDQRDTVTHLVKFPVFGPDGEIDGIGAIETDVTDHSRTEEELREISGRLELAQRQAKVGYWRWSFEDEDLSYWSEQAAEICQYPTDQRISYGEMLASIHPDDRDRVRREYEVADTEPCDYSTEYRIVRGDGRITHVREIGEVEYDENGEAVAHVGFVQDITELKQAQETAGRLMAAIDNLTESVALYDSEDRLVFGNRKFWEHNRAIIDVVKSGDKYESMLRRMIEKGMLPDAAEREEEWIKQRLEQHRNPAGLVEINRQDGIVVQLLEQRLPDGGISTLATDVTHFKKIEADLRASEARLEGILMIAPEAIVVIDGGLRIRHFNKGAERIFGYTQKEIAGQTLDPLIPERFRGTHPSHLEEFRGSPDSFRLMSDRGEITGLRRDGTEFPAAASVSEMVLDDETLFIVALHDVTERHRAEAELLAAKEEAEIANRAKTDFLANMSHELRTPLNSIIGFSQILVDETFGTLGNKKYSEYASDIHSSGRHLLALIADILDISKIETNELEIDAEILNAGQVIRECRKMIGERADSAKIAVSSEVDPDLPPLFADRRMVKQILLNLLTNAIKFTPPGGQVMVRARLERIAEGDSDQPGLGGKAGIRFEVTDTGRGIAVGDLPRVTLPFVQVGEKVASRSQPGTGLGLSLVKALTELHGGVFSIRSKVGIGTKVTVSFPPGRTLTD